MFSLFSLKRWCLTRHLGVYRHCKSNVKHIVDALAVLVHKIKGTDAMKEPGIYLKCSRQWCVRPSYLAIASICRKLPEGLLDTVANQVWWQCLHLLNADCRQSCILLLKFSESKFETKQILLIAFLFSRITAYIYNEAILTSQPFTSNVPSQKPA